MRTQKLPTLDAVPVMVTAFTAASLAIVMAQVRPFQVPRLSPTMTSGSMFVNVAVMVPPAWAPNACVLAPFTFNVSEKTSVCGIGVGPVGGWNGSSPPHDHVDRAMASTNATRDSERFIGVLGGRRGP